MKIIAVTGGKGGTGKTTVATNLAVYYSNMGYSVLLVDADVDGPNAAILLGGRYLDGDSAHILLPKILLDKCIFCGKCAEVCLEHAIIQVGDKPPTLFQEICNGCGACILVCPSKAINESYRELGKIYRHNLHNIKVLTGALNPGEIRSQVVVQRLLERLDEEISTNNYDIVIIDTAPGTQVMVSRVLYRVEYAVAVTEMTPLGLHDLNLLLTLARDLGVNCGIVVNRSDIQAIDISKLHELSKKFSSRILGEIPYDEYIIKSTVEMTPVLIKYPDSPSSNAIKIIANEVLKELKLQ